MDARWSWKWRAVGVGVLVAVLALVAPKRVAGQEDRSILVSGAAAIVGGDVASARNAALADAFQRAVEQILGTLVDAQTYIQNEVLVQNQIYTRAQGYIKAYQILSERQEPGGYRVTAQVVVSTRPLQDDLLRIGLLGPVGNPRLMILYSPEDLAIPDAASFAEQELIRRFTERQFLVVDPATSRRLHREAVDLLRVNPIENVAARLGLEHNAEVVLLYRLLSEPQGSDGTFEHARVTVQARVIVTTTAQILAATTKVSPGAGGSRREAVTTAATKAVGEVADYTIERIVSWWTAYVLNGIPYLVALESVPGSPVDSLFASRLGRIAGVVVVDLRACGGGFCQAQVTYRGSTTRLQQAVIEGLRGERGFEHLAIRSIRGNSLIFTVK